MSAFAADLRL